MGPGAVLACSVLKSTTRPGRLIPAMKNAVNKANTSRNAQPSIFQARSVVLQAPIIKNVAVEASNLRRDPSCVQKVQDCIENVRYPSDGSAKKRLQLNNHTPSCPHALKENEKDRFLRDPPNWRSIGIIHAREIFVHRPARRPREIKQQCESNRKCDLNSARDSEGTMPLPSPPQCALPEISIRSRTTVSPNIASEVARQLTRSIQRLFCQVAMYNAYNIGKRKPRR